MSQPQLQREYSECLICSKPLGAESKDAGFMFCHEHRACVKCSEPISALDAKWALKRFLELSSDEDGLEINYNEVIIIHHHCEVTNHIGMDRDPSLSIRESEYFFLNNLRLSILPDMNVDLVTNENTARIYSGKLISEMSFEEKTYHLKKLESCIANINIALSRDPKNKDRKILIEKFEKARQIKDKASLKASSNDSEIVKTPSRLESNKESNEDIQLTSFIELHSLEALPKAEALKLMRDMNKSIKGLTKNGMPEPEARKLTLGFMIHNKQLSK